MKNLKLICPICQNQFDTKLNQDNTEKEILSKIFEFETYCTSRFDSEARVAMSVYHYVKEMRDRNKNRNK